MMWEAGRESLSGRALVLLGITVLVLVAHAGALRGAFHFDDHFTVINNPAIRTWQPVRWFTSTDAVTSEGSGSYRPLTVATLALNYRWTGLDAWSYLATNLLLHYMVTLLVIVVGRELLGDLSWAVVAGVLYAVHPVNAEAVNYVTARSSLLATVFSLVAAWAFLLDVRGRARRGTRLAGVMAFGCAVLSKESAVVLVIPLLAYWCFRWMDSRPAWDRRERIATAAAYAAPALVFVAAYAAWVTPGEAAVIEPASRPVWTFLEMMARSLGLWFWPWPLGLDHPLTFLLTFDAVLAAGVVGGLGAAGVAVLRWRTRIPVAGWGLTWAIAGLLPLAPLPWLTIGSLLQEHRIGFSAVGLAWMTSAWFRAMWITARRLRAGRPIQMGMAVVGVAVLATAVVVDRSRADVWTDDRDLWAEVVRRAPDNAHARINLGSAYMKAGELDRAESEFRTLLSLAPDYPRANFNLALLALQRGRPDEAKAAFERVLVAMPENAVAQTHLGILALREGDRGTAERWFSEALRGDPNLREALVNQSSLYLEQGKWDPALTLADRALARDPDILEAAYNRAVALSRLGRWDEAVAALRDVRARLPMDPAYDPFRSGIDRLLAEAEP